jgi:hypothetical protein
VWTYQGEEVTKVPKGMAGFVYLITNKMTGRMYIGRKYFTSTTKPKGSTRKKTVESNWKNYWGSCAPLLDEIKEHGPDSFHREILHYHPTKGKVNYGEVSEQFKRDVLTALNSDGTRMYYNGNIMSRYFAAPDTITDEHRQKLSESAKNRKWSQNSLDKKSDSMRRQWASLDSDTRIRRVKKFIESKPRNPTEETKEKISNTLKGRSLAPETVAKLKDREPWNKGIIGDEWKKRRGNNQDPPSLAGKIRITNGIIETLINPDTSIPDGFWKGRLRTAYNAIPCEVKFRDGTEKSYPSGQAAKKELKLHQRTFDKIVSGNHTHPTILSVIYQKESSNGQG